MKRMFVRPQVQKRGVGRALAEALMAEARAEGYETMWLDTSVRQAEAQGLYRSLGFETVSPYYVLPPDMVNWLVFMRKDLCAAITAQATKDQGLPIVSLLRHW